MAKNVYLFPACLAGRITYAPQNNVLAEREFFGGWSQETEVTPRVRVTIEGEILAANHASWETFVDRIAGGTALFAIANQTLRLRQGWDDFPAVNSSGVEYWRENGATAAFPGGTPTSPWRTAACAAFGAASADATSIAVDGLLANETVKAGTPIRVSGVYRHTVRTDATANGSGEVTLQIGHPLRAAVADNATITIPGDLAVYRLLSLTPGAADQDGVEPFSIAAEEVYESQITGGFTWVVD